LYDIFVLCFCVRIVSAISGYRNMFVVAVHR
jgi:hypothetical protein